MKKFVLKNWYTVYVVLFEEIIILLFGYLLITQNVQASNTFSSDVSRYRDTLTLCNDTLGACIVPSLMYAQVLCKLKYKMWVYLLCCT